MDDDKILWSSGPEGRRPEKPKFHPIPPPAVVLRQRPWWQRLWRSWFSPTTMLAGALLGVSAVCLLFMTGVVRGPGPRLQVDPEALYLPSELSGMRLLVEGRIRTDGDSSAYYLDLNGTIIRIDRPADQVQDGQPFKAVIQLLGNGMDFEVLDIYFFEDEKPGV